MSAPLPCGDRSETGYICTLPAGHASAHADWTGSIAGRDVAPRAMWPYWPGVSEPDDAPSVPPVVWVEVNGDGAAVGATSSVAERDDLMRDGWRIVEYVPRAALDAADTYLGRVVDPALRALHKATGDESGHNLLTLGGRVGAALDAMRAERDEARRQAAEAYERAAKVFIPSEDTPPAKDEGAHLDTR